MLSIALTNKNDYHAPSLIKGKSCRMQWCFIGLGPGLASASFSATAGTVPEFRLIPQDYAWQPAELKVLVGTKSKVLVTHEDTTAPDFEGNDLSREKIVLPGGTVAAHILGSSVTTVANSRHAVPTR